MSARGEAPAPLASAGLVEQVRRALDDAPAGPHVLSLPAGDTDPLALLAPGADAFLWTDRDGRVTAARDHVFSLNAEGAERFDQIRDLLHWAALTTRALDRDDPPPPRFVGRAAFGRADSLDEAGRSVDATFALPHVAWIDDARLGPRLQLAVADAGFDAARDQLAAELSRFDDDGVAARAPLPRVHGVLDAAHERDAWRELVRGALAAIDAGDASKIVLARGVRLTADAEIDARALAHALLRADGTYRYVVREGDVLFAGASPERLVEKHGDVVRTEAVAGTAPAEHDGPPLDEREKDRREHLAVVLAIEEALAPHTLALEHAAAPEIRKHGRIAHLVTPFDGRVAPGTHVLQLAGALHPTPAVAGTPRDAALGFIAQHEHLRRGFYAGPIGWFDLDGDGELAVALRCVRIRGTAVDLYAGAGIVAGSDPDAEFDETVLKMRSTLASLGLVLSA